MANVSQIKLPDGISYNIKDSISGYTNNIGTITKVQTTAGAHTTINVSSGAATFNVPTKTSHLTNDSGFITEYTDTKLQVAAVTSGTTYYPIVGTGTTAATRQYDTTGFKYKGTTGTTNAVGTASLELGNATISGTAGNKQGLLKIFGEYSTSVDLYGPNVDDDGVYDITFPAKTGTVALTSDIPSSTRNSTTDITASTTATKTTLGTAFTIPNITSVGSASSWVFEDVACDDITAWSAGSGSFTSGAFSGGSGSFSATVSGHVLSFSHTHTAATHAADTHTHTAPSLTYSAKTGSHVKSGGNGSAPTLGTAFTVPNVTGNTSATVSITDNGHSHTMGGK